MDWIDTRDFAKALARAVFADNQILGVATKIKGLFGVPASELGRMLFYFRSGRYVADTKIHDELLGPSPSKEDAIRRWATEKGLVAR